MVSADDAFREREEFEQRLSEAQGIIYSLAERPEREDPDVQERFARAALEVCRNCADAYLMLAAVAEEYDDDPERARELYENGVAAGERALKKLRGPDVFKNDRGAFYAILESRGYVRARGEPCEYPLRAWREGSSRGACKRAAEAKRGR